jgi:hypothetical protein
MSTSIFGFSPRFDPNRRALESERATYLILKESLIGEVQFAGTIGENHERGWRNRGLGQILNPNSITWRRGALKIDILQETVHLPGGDTLSALLRNPLDSREDTVHILAAGS